MADRVLPRPVAKGLRDLSGSLAAWRRLRGVTQAQLADRADVGVNTVRRLERGDGGVSTENLLRVLRALGVLDDVVGAADPQRTEVGRLRALEDLPRAVRPRREAWD